MTRPQRFLVRMTLFVLICAVVAGLLFEPLLKAFEANPILNGLILATLLFGMIYAYRQVIMLWPEVDWLETFRRGEPGLSTKRTPKLLAPMATMLGERPGRKISLSALSTRSILDSISARLDENRDISRYLIGLLIFLGLLGTFWGLLGTISSVGDTIASLSIGAGDFGAVFSDLKDGLRAPLNGMSVAFSSSLFGLAGSLILGFLELQASQAQNRFYNDLEEWLSSYTRLSSGIGPTEGDQSVPAYVGALLEQTADSLENLQRTLARNEESRSSERPAFNSLMEQLASLTDQMRAEQDLMVKLVENQIELKPMLERLGARIETSPTGLDEASRSHLRSIDIYLQQFVVDSAEGRNQAVSELRSEIKMLARTIAALAEEAR